MKASHAIAVLMLLVMSSIGASLHSYRCTEAAIVDDMNRALALTLAEKRTAVITPDTISSYRSHLRIAALRRTSIVSYAMGEARGGLCSDDAEWPHGEAKQRYRSYANCSMATIWHLSDQRPAAVMSLLALVWLALAAARHHRQTPSAPIGAPMLMATADGGFVDARRQEIHFTPMQRQLMDMFLAAPGHRLAKSDICAALWPKKPDASATLYTLIKRLKPVLESRCHLLITTERGGDYRLVENQHKPL